MKVVNDPLPGIMLYLNVNPGPYTSALTGPQSQTPETLANWNMWDWSWQ